MDEALNNGAKGIAIFTVGSLRSPEIREKFKAYADSARASRSAAKPNPDVSEPKVVNTNPFEKTGIMNAVNLHILAYLSLAKASVLPELKNTDLATIELVLKNALQVNTAEDYINRLKNAPRRNQELEPVAKAITDQFIRDNNQADINLSGFELINEYGATKHYKVTEQNSKVVFDVAFYSYGGIISGWSVEPEKASYETYKKGLGS
jgi:hypothetical protein